MSGTAEGGVSAEAPGAVQVRRALLTVSDKRGLVDFARGLTELGVEIVSTGGHRARAGGRGRRGAPDRGPHRLPRDARRPGQDAEPADLRRPAGGALEARARQHARRARDRADRPRVREPVPVRARGRAARRRRRRGHREHRHRRADADPGGRQEPRLHRGGHQPRELRRRARGDARGRRRPVRPHAREPGARGLLPDRPLRRRDLALVRRARGGLPGPGHHAPTRRCSTSPTARTPTSARRCTRRPARAPTCCRWSPSCTARSCRSTTCSTSTRRGGWSRSSSSRRRRSSSTTTRAAARWEPIPPRPSRKALATDRQSAFGGVMAFNRPVDRALAEELHAMFVELVFAPGLRRRRARGAPAEAQHPPPAQRGAPQPAGDRAGPQARARRDARPGPRHGRRGPARHAGRDRAQADRAGVGRAAVRDARLQARALERDRAGARPGHGRRGRGPDEPGRLGAASRSTRRARRAST